MEKSYLFMKLLLKSHSPFIVSPITQHGINSFLLVLHWATHLPFCGAPTTFLPVLWSNISRAGSMSYLCFYFQQHLAQTLAKKGKEEKKTKEGSVGDDMEKLEPLGTAGGDRKWCGRCRKVRWFLRGKSWDGWMAQRCHTQAVGQVQ